MSASPRIVRVGLPVPPVLIRTDGAHEEDSGTPTTCGALLVDQVNGVIRSFGIAVPEAVREAWKVSRALPSFGTSLGPLGYLFCGKPPPPGSGGLLFPWVSGGRLTLPGFFFWGIASAIPHVPPLCRLGGWPCFPV